MGLMSRALKAGVKRMPKEIGEGGLPVWRGNSRRPDKAAADALKKKKGNPYKDEK